MRLLKPCLLLVSTSLIMVAGHACLHAKEGAHLLQVRIVLGKEIDGGFYV